MTDLPITIQSYKQGVGLFIRAFFANNTFNANRWGVTQEALNRDIATGVEKTYFGQTAPVINTPDNGHPPDDVPDMIAAQEPHRKGDFIATGIDPKSNRAYFDAIIRDPETIARIQSKELNYISPSIRAISDEHTYDGKIRVTRFAINHAALVKKPAYGEYEAQIRGTCLGTADQCLPVLANVQASTKIGVMPCGGVQINISAESVPDYIKEKIKNKSVITVFDVEDMMNKQSETKFTCYACGKTFDTDEERQKHYEQYHPNKNADEINDEKRKSRIEKYENETEERRKNRNADDFGRHEYIPGERNNIGLRVCKRCGYPLNDEKHKISNQAQIDLFKQADECVSKWIPELKNAHPEWKQDQVVAVAYAKCKEGKQASYEPDEGEINFIMKQYKVSRETAIHGLKRLEEDNKRASIDEEKKEFYHYNEMSPEKKKQFDEFHHIGERQALKGKNANNYSMSYEEEQKKKQEMEDENKEKEKNAGVIATLQENIKSYKAELDTLKSVIDSNVKTPIVTEVVQAKISAGIIQAKDKQAEIDKLMKMDVAYLTNLKADYSAMLNVAKTEASKSLPPSHPRFSYSASVEEDKTLGKNVLKEIRSRCSN